MSALVVTLRQFHTQTLELNAKKQTHSLLFFFFLQSGSRGVRGKHFKT